MKQSRLVLFGMAVAAVGGTLVGPSAGLASSSNARGARLSGVNIRVEGIRSTLLPETFLNPHKAAIDPDGKPADTCEGDTAAAVLQQATHGHWTAGSYYSGLGYSVVGIMGESYPFTSAYYWSFWVDGKVATAGICGIAVHPGAQLLFFPQCSKESVAECPNGLFNPPVLQILAPGIRGHRLRAGKTIALKVLSLENSTGKPTPGAGVKLSVGGRSVTAGASGVAHLRLPHAGRYRISASKPGAIRDELTVSVRP